MKTGNTPSQSKKLLLGAIVAFVALGGGLAFIGSGSGWLLSQFSGTNVTPSTAAGMWQPSANNPNRAAVATYSTRLDAIVISILGRGTGLSATGFTTYLKNLSTGITALAAGPKYANDAEVQKISAYLTYELTDTATALSSGNMFMDDLIVLVNNTGGVQCPNFTAPPAPPTGCNYVSNPPNANGCATPMTLVCANTGTVANSGGTVTTVAPTAPGITSLTSVQLASSATYRMVWTKVTGVDYFTAIDAGTSAGGNNVGGISTWAIPLSGFAPGSTHTANVKACNTGTTVCSSWSTVNIGITENSSATAPVFNFTTAEYAVATGATIKLNWYQMTGVSTCVAGGDWSGNKPVAGGGNGGSENITIQSAKNFTLTCTGPTGLSTTKTIAITMLPPPENPPVDAVCGSLAGQWILRDTLTASTPNTCSVGKFIKTYKYNWGTQFEPYYDYLVENAGTMPAPYMTANYQYTCEGINGGKNAICRTGKIKEDGVCWGELGCTSGILKLTDEQDRYDSKKYKDGELNWECTGYSNGTMNTPTACKAEAFGQNPVCWSSYFQSSAATTSLGYISYQAGGANEVHYEFNPDIVCDLPNGLTSRKADFVTPIDLVGADGKFDWKCSGVDRFGKPSNETVTCSVTRIFPGECWTNNGTTMTQVESDSSFYQSWGGPILLKYCKIGYPHYTDQIGTDGSFDWTCDVPGARTTECKATKG